MFLFFWKDELTQPKCQFCLHKKLQRVTQVCVILARAVSVLRSSTQVPTGLVFLLHQRVCRGRRRRPESDRQAFFLFGLTSGLQLNSVRQSSAHVCFHSREQES